MKKYILILYCVVLGLNPVFAELQPDKVEEKKVEVFDIFNNLVDYGNTQMKENLGTQELRSKHKVITEPKMENQSLSSIDIWPQYNYSFTHQGATHSALTVPLEVKWENFATASGYKPVSPVVYGDTIYLGKNLRTEPGTYTEFCAYNTLTGDLKWKYRTESPFISTTPAVGPDQYGNIVVIFGDSFYTPSNDTYIYCVRDQGGYADLKWRFNTGQSTLETAITLTDDSVLFACSKNRHITLYCLDFETGQLRWSFSKDNNLRDTYAAPAVDTIIGDCYFVAEYEPESADYLYIFDKQGNSHGEIFIGPHIDSVYSSPVIYDTMVFVGSRDGNVYAISAVTQKVLWTFNTGISISCSPTLNVNLGLLYIADDNYVLYALDINDGTERWSFSLGSTTELNTGSASISLYNNILLMAFPEEEPGDDIYIDSLLYALNAETGTDIWHMMITKWGWTLKGTPVIVDDAVYITQNNFLTKLQRPEDNPPVEEIYYSSIGNDVRADYPYSIYAHYPYLKVGWIGSYGIYRSFLYADLSGIPSRAEVVNAVFEFHKSSTTWADDIGFAIYNAEEGWGEDISWATMPEVSIEPISIGEEFQYHYAFNCTQLVQDWVSGTKPNYGIMVAKEDEGLATGGIDFYSDDYYYEKDRPRFVVWYRLNYPPEFDKDIDGKTYTVRPPSGMSIKPFLTVTAVDPDGDNVLISTSVLPRFLRKIVIGNGTPEVTIKFYYNNQFQASELLLPGAMPLGQIPEYKGEITVTASDGKLETQLTFKVILETSRDTSIIEPLEKGGIKKK